MDTLLASLDRVPDDKRQAVINNGGGHSNHSMFWRFKLPQDGGAPQGRVGEAIERDLGGFEAFKEAFTQAALTRFGSGWSWLSVTPQQTWW